MPRCTRRRRALPSGAVAKAAGVSRSTVQRIWDAHGLQPHRVTTFKLSTDPAFVEKLTDVVGLYLNPPDKAVVLCVDEKSQIQALDRTQPGLPMKPGRRGTLTHDYKRHGTTTLFAALNVLAGAIRRVHAGGHVIDPELAAGAWTDPDPLTDRQRQVLRLAADGRSGPDIAAELHLSEGTVRNYLSEAISKLGARNRVEAARVARAKGWL